MTNKTLAVVFPGQGSQSVGMLADIAREYPIVEKTFSEASSVLGYDLWKLSQAGPAAELDKTAQTQPAVLAAGYALWRILETHKNLQPALLAGHSLGEYTALVCAKSISFTDGIRIVAARGEFMQAAAPAGIGALAAIIGLDDATVRAVCENHMAHGEVLAPANFNSPGQVVIAGHLSAVEKAMVAAKAAGARMVKLLPVSVPSHCLLMKPAAEKLRELLDEIKIVTPEIPVVNNVDVVVYENADAIRDGLTTQMYMPVRWVEIIEYFVQRGIDHIIECGPGKVLSGLNKRIAPNVQLMSTADVLSLKEIV